MTTAVSGMVLKAARLMGALLLLARLTGDEALEARPKSPSVLGI
jgi:hypothetical protein